MSQDKLSETDQSDKPRGEILLYSSEGRDPTEHHRQFSKWFKCVQIRGLLVYL